MLKGEKEKKGRREKGVIRKQPQNLSERGDRRDNCGKYMKNEGMRE